MQDQARLREVHPGSNRRASPNSLIGKESRQEGRHQKGWKDRHPESLYKLRKSLENAGLESSMKERPALNGQSEQGKDFFCDLINWFHDTDLELPLVKVPLFQ